MWHDNREWQSKVCKGMKRIKNKESVRRLFAQEVKATQETQIKRGGVRQAHM